MPERMPEMDAYDDARKMGVRGDVALRESGLVIIEWMDVDGEGDLERECAFLSMSGVRSVTVEGSTAELAVVAVVSREGAELGASRGDNGGLTSASL